MASEGPEGYKTDDAPLARPGAAAAAGPGFRGAARGSTLRANVFAAESAATLAAYLYVLFAKGAVWTGYPKTPLRCALLAGCGVVYILRVNVMARWLLPRELAMEEVTVVPLWIAGIMASYGLAAVHHDREADAVSITASMVLYILGSYCNSGSELQRKWWKARPENKGRCYTEGLFSLSRNINYFGDVLLFAGWAVASGRWWNSWAPLVMAASFHFHHIPDKEAYLAQRYARDWPDYARRTKAFIPFVC